MGAYCIRTRTIVCVCVCVWCLELSYWTRFCTVEEDAAAWVCMCVYVCVRVCVDVESHNTHVIVNSSINLDAMFLVGIWSVFSRVGTTGRSLVLILLFYFNFGWVFLLVRAARCLS